MNKIKITIGIPTYNEEQNIGKLLNSILSQKEIYFEIEKIIIISDATDNTNKIIESYQDKRIELIKNIFRKGQINAQNSIFKLANSDILVLFEADTLPKDELYIHKLIEPMVKDPAIGMTQGNWIAYRANKFVEKVLEAQFNIYHAESLREENILPYLCSARGGRAFTKTVYKSLTWPQSIPEDVYGYLWCRVNNIKTVFVKQAVIYYRCAQSIQDYYLERQKISSARRALRQYYSQQILDIMYARPLPMKLRIILKLVFKNPYELLSYIGIKIYCLLLIRKKTFSDIWPITQTTKNFYS